MLKNFHIYKKLVLENEGTNMKRARKYLESKGIDNDNKRWEIITTIRNDIPNSRLKDCKFLQGVCRLYMEGQLRDGHNIMELNKILKYIASDEHVNEYDYNLNGEPLDTLINRFSGVAKGDLEQDKEKSSSRNLTANKAYRIVPIDNFNEARKYSKYTSWCVTHGKDNYDAYTNNGSGRFYFCLKNGFEQVPEMVGPNCPLDEYGLSMVAVSVDMDGSLNTCTCRWNHDNGGNDHIMNREQIEDLLGVNFYQVFKPYSREELHAKGVILFDEVQDLLDSGKEPEEIFEWAGEFEDGFAVVNLNGKYNYINEEGKLISNQWFDNAYNFSNGFARVVLNGKYNYINEEGKLISNQWFDRVGCFYDGFARVVLNRKMHTIDTKGKIVEGKSVKKTLILNEEQVKVIKNCVSNNPKEIYTIEPSKVLIVKKYLDANFKKGIMNTIGNNGFPKTISIISMVDANGNVIKNMYKDELLDMLISKFKKMYLNKDRRDKFLGQVMNDWYNNKIGQYGSLSVNHL